MKKSTSIMVIASTVTADSDDLMLTVKGDADTFVTIADTTFGFPTK